MTRNTLSFSSVLQLKIWIAVVFYLLLLKLCLILVPRWCCGNFQSFENIFCEADLFRRMPQTLGNHITNGVATYLQWTDYYLKNNVIEKCLGACGEVVNICVTNILGLSVALSPAVTEANYFNRFAELMGRAWITTRGSDYSREFIINGFGAILFHYYQQLFHLVVYWKLLHDIYNWGDTLYAPSVYGSGHGTAVVFLPGFAIIW